MSLNRVTLLGNVGKDPEVRYLDTGVCVAQFSLATTEKGYTTQDGKQYPDKTEWHDIVAWRGIAQTIEKYVRKGDKLYIEGKLRHSSYEDSTGTKRFRTDIYVDNMEMLTPRGEGKPVPQDLGQPVPQPTQPAMQVPRAQTTQAAPAPQKPSQQQMNFDAGPGDDLPF